MSETREPSTSTTHRAGVAALLGPPNAGKSTLLNRVLGQKLAITSAKPQTTRSRILGISNVPGAQVIWLDTPGRHEGTRPLNHALNDAVEEAARDCDLGLLLVDPFVGWSSVHEELLSILNQRGVPALGIATKSDGAGRAVSWPREIEGKLTERLHLSARTGEGIPELLRAVADRLPLSPPLYPEDVLTDRPLRWLAAELVREAAFEELKEELPYSIAVEVVTFDESRPDRVHIEANILVLRDSQKRIVVGRGGEVVKRISMAARRGVEDLVGLPVGLRLFVKIDRDWLRKPRRLASLGYR